MCMYLITASNYTRQKLTELKGEIEINTPLSLINRTSRISVMIQKNFISQLEFIDMYRTLHPTTAEFTFFSSLHGIFTKIDQMLGHKTCLKNVKGLKNM